MAPPALTGTSKRSHIRAKLVKCCQFCVFGRLAGGGQNLDKSEIETESL